MGRVVITGIGVISPAGKNKIEFWKNSQSGISQTNYDNDMDKINISSKVNSKIETDLNELIEQNKEIVNESRFSKLCVYAAEQAIKDSKIDFNDIESDEIGIITCSAIGGTPTIQEIYEDITDKGKKEVSYKKTGERFYNAGMFNFPGAYIAKKYGLRNVCYALSTGCTAGLDVIGEGFNLIKEGVAKVLLIGGSEAPLTSLTYATLDVINALSKWTGDPKKASRPFDFKRQGFVIGESSVFFTLEDLDHALQREAHIYCEIDSFASYNNAYHMTDLKESKYLEKAISMAIKRAGKKINEFGYINAHGSSTKQNDKCETEAIKSSFGKYAKKIPISSSKSMVGHPLAVAGLVGVLACAGVFHTGFLPPNINYEYKDSECDLYYLKKKKRMDVNTVLTSASGFGGIHSATVLSRYEEKNNE
ncbi:beta-ketoacyl-[acyl-carrier-protein] synthase family protein [Candidatus Enterococcus mansonii]|uniref:Ketosynthase family 3 (KS3) domain-containing protein n=1 Tax=Candidatus Enterococcus mansonii TaxID=1834181 RepID=A0A242CHK4_9ENTE|nr:beta-ketoacyl-[acyl-carrier-protein] synthase family protein [Enterococcus sp. 4G2_DIV0659]OTO09691.1 hypothetical protein A5880_000371 [Enterococcus sp. 4G2_DIV0659]